MHAGRRGAVGPRGRWAEAIRAVLGVGLVLSLLALPAGAGELELALEPVATFASPLHVTHAGDDRLFVVEEQGVIRIYTEKDGVLPEPFLDIRDRVFDFGNGGLYAIAFHPDYAKNGRFFLSHTGRRTNPLATAAVVARYERSANPDLASVASGVELLRLNQPAPSHNFGQIAFGPADLYLYIGSGDGGLPDDPGCRAQNVADGALFGKLLRIDVDQNADVAPYHGIPPDNPFADPDDGRADEIWALGFRNPWRIAFDRDGGLFIGDPGQVAREEVSYQPPDAPGGVNYGWAVMEGTYCFTPEGEQSCPKETPPCFDPVYVPPILDYRYTGTNGNCAVIGGLVHRGSQIPELAGTYIFGDYCSGRIFSLVEGEPGEPWVPSQLLRAGANLTSFGEDASGELYVTVGDEVQKIVRVPFAPSLPPALIALVSVVSLRARRRPSAHGSG